MLSPEKVTTLIGYVYDAALDPQLWDRFITATTHAFHGHVGTVVLLDQARPESNILRYHGFDPDEHPEWLERWQQEDYWLKGTVDIVPPATVVTGTELIGLREMHRRPFYHEIYRGLDLEYLIGNCVEMTSERTAYVSVLRGRRDEDFDADAKRAMALLTPHLQKAYFIHQQLQVSNSGRLALERALDRSPYGVAIVNCDGRPLFANQKAERIFSQADGVTLRRGHVRLTDHRRQKAFDRGLKEACGIHLGTLGDAGCRLRIERPSGKLAYQMVITPLGGVSDQIALPPGGTAALFVHDPAAVPAISTDSLRTAYGLTMAEAAVCALLFSCTDLNEVAEHLEISHNTARTHLRNIFAKCGVNSQVALMRTLALGLNLEPGSPITA